ncbi:hypothetical protein VTI28DRAFT_8969 [Corynascus sepedonium]
MQNAGQVTGPRQCHLRLRRRPFNGRDSILWRSSRGYRFDSTSRSVDRIPSSPSMPLNLTAHCCPTHCKKEINAVHAIDNRVFGRRLPVFNVVTLPRSAPRDGLNGSLVVSIICNLMQTATTREVDRFTKFPSVIQKILPARWVKRNEL